jgi:hypothetical protein
MIGAGLRHLQLMRGGRRRMPHRHSQIGNKAYPNDGHKLLGSRPASPGGLVYVDRTSCPHHGWSRIYWISPLRSAVGTRDNFYNPTQHACAVLAARAPTPIGQGRHIFDIDAITVTANYAVLPSAKLADPLRQFRLPRGGFRAIRECAPCVVRESR